MGGYTCSIISAVCGPVYCGQGRQMREQRNPIINELLVFIQSLVSADRVTRDLFMCLIALYTDRRDCAMIYVYDISFNVALLDMVFLGGHTMTITRAECVKKASAFLALLETC